MDRSEWPRAIAGRSSHVAGCLRLDEQASVVPWERELVATQKIVDHLFPPEFTRFRGALRTYLEHFRNIARQRDHDRRLDVRYRKTWEIPGREILA